MRGFLPSLAAAVALGLLAAPAAATCAAVKEGRGVASLPEPWRQAIAALVARSGIEGRPWSCTGGEVDLTLHDGGATLSVTDAEGHSVTREVSVPEEIVPLGEALLSRPLVIEPPAEPSPAPAAPAQAPAAAPAQPDAPPLASAPLADPRVLLSALVAPRYAGRADLIWGGVIAAVTVPIGAWGVGAWGRYDGISARVDEHAARLREFVVGASGSRSFMFRNFELRTSLAPSVAIVTKPGERGGPDETHVDGRIGAEVRGVIPFTPLLRGVVALDAEIAPGEFGGDDAHHSKDMMPPPNSFPSYTLGLGVGLEVAIR
jgi:hypothetical protein